MSILSLKNNQANKSKKNHKIIIKKNLYGGDTSFNFHHSKPPSEYLSFSQKMSMSGVSLISHSPSIKATLLKKSTAKKK